MKLRSLVAALFVVLAAGSATAQITPISDVNANAANGTAVMEFQTVTIEGIVQLGGGVLAPFDDGSVWIYVADGTGGVAVIDVSGTAAVTDGDQVQATGMVGTYPLNPLAGTRYLYVTSGANISVIGSGAVDAPLVLAASDVLTGGATWEGSRARVDGLSLVDPAEWPGEGTSGFVRVTDGADEFSLYVDDDTNIDGSPVPAAFDLVGFVAQNDPSSPYLDGHILLPTSTGDFVSGDGSGTVVVTPEVVLESAVDITLSFTLEAQEQELETLGIEIPAAWEWAVPGDLSVAGSGFAAATAGYQEVSPGRYTVWIGGATVLPGASGTVTVGSLTAPDSLAEYVFLSTTATAGGVPSAIGESPSVRVRAQVLPGDVVINEVYPNTSSTEFEEGAEFVEIFNSTTKVMEIGGWTLADIGRDGPGCDPGPRWEFPAGTELPAGGYAVVCRTAFDPQGPGSEDDKGYLLQFARPDSAVLFLETYDASTLLRAVEADDPNTDNMILLDPSSGDDQMALLGGFQTNAGQCEPDLLPGSAVPYGELVVLRDQDGTVVDAVEYHETGPCEGDLCDGEITGPADAYPFGAPKVGHTLGLDAVSSWTGSSLADLLPSSNPTPGMANIPGDTVAPALIVDSEDAARSTILVEVSFDESVDDASALTAAHYSLTTSGRAESPTVREVYADPLTPNRRYFLWTDPLPAGSEVALVVEGVADLEGNLTSASASFTVPSLAAAFCDVQAFDEAGFSPMNGDTVVVSGFVTLGDIDPVETGTGAPEERLSIWVQDPGGCGANVFSFMASDAAEYDLYYPDVREYGVRVGDLVQVKGTVVEYVSGSGNGAVTEVSALTEDPGFYKFLARGLSGAVPVVVPTGEVGQEVYEGALLETEGVIINSNSLAAYIDDGTGSIQVFQNFDTLDLTRFNVGDRIHVTGVLTQYDSSPPYFSGYELIPQSQDTIQEVNGGFSSSGPLVEVERGILVPALGETIEIRTNTSFRSDMVLEIYDAVGRKVTTLYDGIGLGPQTLSWDGVGLDGSVVEPGMYICHARAVPLDGGSVQTASAPIVVGMQLEGPGGSR
ncbi:MAG: lamin tail domain-containing protein [Gemmatimonadota bacterium]|jgi:hypothetical protein|nr:lamin tail domain-containing protein [Gemmatimonadota bacterium]MDP7031834.1 lamin tail domain-containing protein [Gemmatimonadota bacterium]